MIKCNLKGRIEPQTRELDRNLVKIKDKTKVVMSVRGSELQARVLIELM